MATFYSRDGFVDASLNGEIITVRWEKLFNSNIVKECCEAQLELVEKGAKIIIADTANATGKPSDENQQWFGEYLFPNFQEHGLLAIITVIPKSIITKQAAKQWSDTGAPFGFDLYETTSLIMARKKAREILNK